MRLQEPQVHEGRAAVVLPRSVLDARPGDPEEGDAPSVRATHLDVPELAAADEAQGPEEEVVGLEHVSLPVDCGRRGG